MTREEAIVLLKIMFAFWANTHSRNVAGMEMALNMAVSALRPVRREQVEKVWRAIDADALQELCDRRIQDTWNSGTAPVSWAHAYADFKDDIDSMPTLTPPNEPLTLEQLLRMDGAPVWLDVAGGMWALVDALDGCLWLDRGGSIDIAKFAGKAYRRPPEGEV